MKALLAFILAAAPLTAAEATPKVPRPAPEFAIHMLDGSQLLLSSCRGKVVLLAFVHTTCPHCQAMMGTLTPIAKEYGPKGVQILASAFNDNAATLLPGFIQYYVRGFPAGWDPAPSVFEFLQLDPVHPNYFVPILVFIDRKGTIREQYIGDENYLRTPDPSVRGSLDRMLALPSGPAVSAKRKATPAKAQ